MRQCLQAALASFALSLPAAAQDVDELSKTAVDAALSYMAGTLLCSELLGNSYIVLGRSALESAVRAHGVTGDALMIQVDDLEQELRRQQGDRSIRDIIGQDGVTEADVTQSCLEELSEGLRATQVATARYRQATGQ
jgi:hypothetical protein